MGAVDLGSRSGLIGLINLKVKCAGAPSVGNPPATCDVAGLEGAVDKAEDFAG